MDEAEQQLTGGNVTQDVVRVGYTVRRPAGLWTPSVHAFLSHLRDQGFDGAPRSLGIDDQGRHVVEWIEGDLTHPYRELSNSSPSLEDVGRLVRRFHDAASSFIPSTDASWNVVIEPDERTLIVHHDLAAWNFVHGSGRAAFIDWDLAAPGSRLWDLAWATHSFAGLATGADLQVVGEKLRRFVEGYGLGGEDRRRVVDLLPRRYQAMYDLLEGGHRDGVEPWGRLWTEGHGRTWEAIVDVATGAREQLLEAVAG